MARARTECIRVVAYQDGELIMTNGNAVAETGNQLAPALAGLAVAGLAAGSALIVTWSPSTDANVGRIEVFGYDIVFEHPVPTPIVAMLTTPTATPTFIRVLTSPSFSHCGTPRGAGGMPIR